MVWFLAGDGSSRAWFVAWELLPPSQGMTDKEADECHSMTWW
jgi:hypothetical protein